MINVTLLIPLLIFAGTLISILAIFAYLKQRRVHRELVEKIEHEAPAPAGEEAAVSGGSVKRYLINVATRMGKLIKFKGKEHFPHMKINFLRAGEHGKNAATIFFGFKILTPLLMVILAFLLQFFIFGVLNHFYRMLFLISAALVGFYLPDIWLHLKIARRKEKIMEGCPDALDLLVVCVEAGMGLDAAIDRVTREIELSNKPLSEEFKILTLEMKAGKSRRDAMRDLAIRTDLEDLNNLVTLLVQTDRFGTSVASALRVHSDSMRTQRYQRAEEKAVKLPVKLLFPLILFIFPSLFVIILGPALIRVFRTFLH